MGIGLVCKGRVKRGEVGITLGDGEGAEREAKSDMVDSVWGRSGETEVVGMAISTVGAMLGMSKVKSEFTNSRIHAVSRSHDARFPMWSSPLVPDKIAFGRFTLDLNCFLYP